MIDDFPLLCQSPGENDCLPVAIEAVLLWHGITEYSRPQLAQICRMTEEGCAWYDAVEGLREHFDVEELSQSDAEVMDSLYDAVENNEEPVVARISIEDRSGDIYGHAVVVIGFISEQEVRYMDPLSGDWQIRSLSEFRKRWILGGSFALILRP